jgi:hypothetical protein
MKPLVAIGILFSLPAYGVPAQFTHQGRIVDGDELPLEGERDIAFRLMEADFGGGPVREDTLVVSIDNGFYAAVLGTDVDDNPLDTDVLEQAPLWLEIQIVG